MKAPLLFLFTLCLAGCAYQKTDVRNEAEAARFDPSNTARIRLFTGEGTQGGYVVGSSCEAFFTPANSNVPPAQIGWKDAHVHTAGLFPWRESDTRNLVIGIPPSNATKNVNTTQQVYDEYVVPANQPLLVSLFSWSSAVSCRPTPISFTPEAGRDYEFQLEGVKISTFRGGCIIGARRLISLGSGAPTVELPLLPDLCVTAPNGMTRTVNRLDQAEQIHKDESPQ